MFSPTCQQSVSKQVLGSRGRKKIYHALRWMAGQKQYWLVCGSSTMSSHVGSIPLATSLMFLFPPTPLLTEISLCIKCSVMGWERIHIFCQFWFYLVISQIESCFPRKPPPVSLKAGRPCLTYTFLVSPEICYYLLASSHFEQTQEKPVWSWAALSDQVGLASLYPFPQLARFNSSLDATIHTVEKLCAKWKSMISLNYRLQ